MQRIYGYFTLMIQAANKPAFLFKYQTLLLFIALTLWLAIGHMLQKEIYTWTTYGFSVITLVFNQLPVLIFSLYKNQLQEKLSHQQFFACWAACFLLAVPIFTAFCITWGPRDFEPMFFVMASGASILLECLLIANSYYQRKIQHIKWIKKMSLENAVLISIILIALTISVMMVSSLNNPIYHSKERLLVGFEFSFSKLVNYFGQFVGYFLQFLFMYLCGYLFFLINSRLLVPRVLKLQGLLLYLLSLLATLAFLYPFIAQMLIWLPINQTLGRDIFSENAFVLENAFGALAIMLFSLPIVLSLQWGQQNTKILSLEKEKSQTELDLLKQQLNPHFFFNTLNNLYALSLQKSEQTSASILQLAELMRYTIYKGQEQTVGINQEIDYLTDYIELQQIRLKKSLALHFEKQITNANLQLPPLLLIVLVENAFKHGIEPAEESAILNLSIHCNEQELTFICQNSFEPSKNDATPGIGLMNLRKRLDLLYPNAYRLDISSNALIFEAKLYLKFR